MPGLDPMALPHLECDSVGRPGTRRLLCFRQLRKIEIDRRDAPEDHHLDLRAAQVDIGVVDGHAVVAGVVESAAKVDRIVALARSAEGVVDVRSFVQVKSVAAAVPFRPVPKPPAVVATPPPAALAVPPASPLSDVQSE